MAVVPYLNFNGNCKEAMDFYASIFKESNPKIIKFGEMPGNDNKALDENTKELVLNGNMKICGSEVLFSDIQPGQELIIGNNIHINIYSSDLKEIEEIFNSLKVGGIVVNELKKTFWTKSYGFLIDKFGIGWMFNYLEK